MPPAKLFGRCLVAALFTAPLAAKAINVCTDAHGITVYQQQPCVSVAPRRENAPVAAKQVTAAVALETIRRFRASLSSRDATTAASFLAPNFQASIRDAKGLKRYDRVAFSRMMVQVLDAAKSFQSTARCATPVVSETSVSVACEVRESYTILHRTDGGSSKDVHTIAVVDGVAKLLSVSSEVQAISSGQSSR